MSGRSKSRDGKLVAGNQDYEMRYEKEKTGATKKELKDAIRTEGNSRRKIEDKLKTKDTK
jgi:hypothetical protein